MLVTIQGRTRRPKGCLRCVRPTATGKGRVMDEGLLSGLERSCSGRWRDRPSIVATRKLILRMVLRSPLRGHPKVLLLLIGIVSRLQKIKGL